MYIIDAKYMYISRLHTPHTFSHANADAAYTYTIVHTYHHRWYSNRWQIRSCQAAINHTRA